MNRDVTLIKHGTRKNKNRTFNLTFKFQLDFDHCSGGKKKNKFRFRVDFAAKTETLANHKIYFELLI